MISILGLAIFLLHPKMSIVLDFSINKKPRGLLTADLLSQREETDLLSLAVSLESNLMGRLPNMLCDTRLVWSGSISLYSVPLNLTVKFAATLVTFLRKLHHKSCYLLIKVVGCTLSLRVITRGTGVKTKFKELLEISCKEVKGTKTKKTKKNKKKQKTFTVKKSVKTKTGEKLRSHWSVLPGYKAFIYHIVKTLTIKKRWK